MSYLPPRIRGGLLRERDEKRRETDARDGREYRVRWFVWAQGERAPLGKRLEWRRYADFVNRALAGLVLWACVHRPVVCYGCKEGNCFRHTGPD